MAATDLEHQLEQLDELLSLFDASALREAQESLEHQIADLTERLEVTRQALAQAHAQRRRLARARLLLEGSAPSAGKPNGDAEELEEAEEPGETDEPEPTSLEERRKDERRKDERRKPERRDTSEPIAAG
jgi:deoxyribodipyrimidine photolyase-like uncharacterized protein